MKKLSTNLVFVFTLLVAAYSCSDDVNSGIVAPGQFDGMYTNKSVPLNGQYELYLEYSGTPLTGKEVYVDLGDQASGVFTLFEVLPGEKKIEIPVSGTRSQREFSFSGSYITPRGTTFDYTGFVSPGYMSFELKEVVVGSSGIATGQPLSLVQQRDRETIGDTPYYYNHHALRIYVPGEMASTFSMASTMVGKLLNVLLRDVTFHHDGNITAHFAPMPEGEGIVQDILFGDPYVRPDHQWKESPRNMAFYYVEDDVLYIVPNADMIVGRLLSANSRDGEGTSIGDYLDAYLTLTDWFTDGIPLAIRRLDDPGTLPDTADRDIQEGDYFLYLGKDDIEPFAALLPLIADLLPDSFKEQGVLYNLVSAILSSGAEAIKDAETVEIGVYLKR